MTTCHQKKTTQVWTLMAISRTNSAILARSMCGQYDDVEYEYEYNRRIQNFQSGRMCCVCGGGNGAIKSTKEKPASGVFAIGFEQDLLLSGNFDTKTLNLPDLEDLATTLENIADNDAASSRNVLFQNRGILMTANKVRHFCISFFFLQRTINKNTHKIREMRLMVLSRFIKTLRTCRVL